MPSVKCKDLILESYVGETLIVDVTNYDHEKNGDLALFSWTGTRQGVFDGGPESPQPRVRVIGAKVELVYDDDAKQVKLMRFRE